MGETSTILVVDDDESIAELLRDFLENEQYRVLTACDGAQALELFHQHTVHAMIVDIMMPGLDGFELCRRIRAQSEVPILFLSARSDDVDKIRGLTLGGDDYIVKSASIGEIVARVKAVLRRSGSQVGRGRSAVLDCGRLKIDLTTREVSVDGHSVLFTPKEYDLLQWFAEHPRHVLTFEQLLDKFWDGVGDKHTVRVHLSRLRDKLETNPDLPPLLTNIWGVGYRFEGS